MTVRPREGTLLVAGYYGYGNLGDEAIRAALQRALAKRPDLRVRWLVVEPRSEDEIARMSPLEVCVAVRRCSALVLGGGGLLQNRTSNRSLHYYLGLLFAARFFHRPAFLLGQGIGPIGGRLARWLVRRALRGTAIIDCRDRRSLTALRDLGVEGTLGGDLLLLDPPPDAAPRRDEQRRIAFCLKGTPVAAEGVERFARLLQALRARRPGLEIVLLPFFPAQDLRFAQRIAARAGSGCSIWDAGTPEDAASAIAAFDLVVSSRLHPLVFAARAGTRSLGIPVDPKIPGFLEEIRDLGGPKIPCEPSPSVETVLGALDAPPAAEVLRAACDQMHKRARTAFMTFLDAVDRSLEGGNG